MAMTAPRWLLVAAAGAAVISGVFFQLMRQSPGPMIAGIFAGLTILGTRFGAAFSNDPDRRDSTLFADLGVNQPFGIGVSMKYTTHQLGTPVSIADGGSVRAFNDWSVKLSRPWMGVDLNLIYSDSSLDGGECSAYSGQNSQCDGLLTFKAERSFY